MHYVSFRMSLNLFLSFLMDLNTSILFGYPRLVPQVSVILVLFSITVFSNSTSKLIIVSVVYALSIAQKSFDLFPSFLMDINTLIPLIDQQFKQFSPENEVWDFLKSRYTTQNLAHQYQLLTTLHAIDKFIF